MKSEPILSKIQRILRIESRPAFPPAFASLRRAKQKNFLYIFLSSAPQNFFQLRKLKFFCFVFLLREELRKRPYPTARLRRAEQAGKNSFSPHPFFFLPACRKPPTIFSDGGGTSNWVVGGVSINIITPNLNIV